MSCSKKIHEKTPSAFPNSLGLFDLPPTNVAFTKTGFREILSLNPVTDEPYSFRIFSDNLWLDLSKTYVQLEFSIQALDSTTKQFTKVTSDSIAPIQLIGNTFFRQLKISLNNTEIYDSGTLYPYRCYLATELSCSTRTKMTELGAAGYYPLKKHNSKSDEGFVAANEVAKKETIQTYSRLDFDLGNSNLLLLNNTDVVFTLYKAPDNFLIQSLNSVECKIVVSSIKLFVMTVDVQPSLNIRFFEKLEQTPALYPLRKIDTRSYFISAGRTEYETNLFTNIIPRRLILGLGESNAFSGKWDKHAFNFQPFNIREINVMASGRQFPSAPYTLDFNKQYVKRAYTDLFLGLGQHFTPHNCGLTLNKFLDGWTLFVFSLTSSGDETDGFELIQNGTTSIKLVFNEAIPTSGLELIALAEFDQILSIDKTRRIISDA